MTSTTHFYLMTNINNSAVTTSALMQAASLVVWLLLLLPLGSESPQSMSLMLKRESPVVQSGLLPTAADAEPVCREA